MSAPPEELKPRGLPGYGVAALIFGAVCPLLVAAGVATEGFAVTGLENIPLLFIALFVMLVIFSVGYLAMAKHMHTVGAFYVFVTRGLGRPVGIAAGLVAIVAYSALYYGLYGAFGPGMHDLVVTNAHVDVPWYVWALGAWLIVAIVGAVRIDFAARILAALVFLEITVAVLLSVRGLLHPHGNTVSFAPFHLSGLGSVTALTGVSVAILGYVGWEEPPVYQGETRHPIRTMRLVTYGGLALMVALYALSSFAFTAHYGPDTQATAARLGPEAFFELGTGWLAFAGRVLFLTSSLGGLLAFHSVAARYIYFLARDGVLPRAWAVTSSRGAFIAASLIQSAIAFVVILLYALGGWDPLTHLFFWLGNLGGFGVFLLAVLTCVSIIFFFARNMRGENLWTAFIAPLFSGMALAVGVCAVYANFGTLLGTSGRPVDVLRNIYVAPVVLGLIIAGWLYWRRPGTWSGLGQEGRIRIVPNTEGLSPTDGRHAKEGVS